MTIHILYLRCLRSIQTEYSQNGIEDGEEDPVEQAEWSEDGHRESVE